jgi:uncharacterized protein YcfJ
MHKMIFKIIFLCVLGSSANAMDCGRLSEAMYEYDSLKNNASSAFRVRNLQQIIGTVNDGQWGRQSEYAYTRYLTQCRSDPSSGTYVEKRSRQVTGGTVVDNFSFETIYEDIPVTKCEIQKLPVYQNTGTGTDDVGAFVSGAIMGGILGKVITKEDGGAAVGAVLGGALANESQKNNSEQIVGYEKKEVCSRKYRTVETQMEEYSHSTITFQLNGQTYSANFVK